MPVYTTSEQSFVKVRQKITKQTQLSSLILIIFFLVLDIWKYFSTGETNFTSVIIGIIVVVILSIVTTNKVIKERKEIWNSLEIRLEDNYISRQQIRIPEVRINREEITAIQESKHGLCILTNDKTRSLLIPIELEQADYLEIKETLSNWTEIKPLSTTQQFKNISIVVLYSTIFIGLFISPFIWLNVILGSILIIWSYYSVDIINKMSGVDPKFKKANKKIFFWTLFIVLINIFGKWYLISRFGLFQQQSPPQQTEQSILNVQ